MECDQLHILNRREPELIGKRTPSELREPVRISSYLHNKVYKLNMELNGAVAAVTNRFPYPLTCSAPIRSGCFRPFLDRFSTVPRLFQPIPLAASSPLHSLCSGEIVPFSLFALCSIHLCSSGIDLRAL